MVYDAHSNGPARMEPRSVGDHGASGGTALGAAPVYGAVRPDPHEIRRALAILTEPESVVELRVPKVREGTRTVAYSGYFNDHGALVDAALRLSARAEGIYITLNPVHTGLLARRHNRIERGRDGVSTADHDILKRRWLPIDCDPVRPSGISASEAEHAAALDRRDRIAAWLRDQGWPDPILADSGNGGHLLYQIDLPVAEDGLVQRCLQALADRFDDARVVVDTSVANPARIWKLYGTVARKGDHTRERPHRLAHITSVPTALQAVPPALLEALAETAAAPVPVQGRWRAGTGFDVPGFLERHQIQVLRGPEPWKDGQKWIIVCPWDPSHTNGSAYIVQLASGAVSAGCHHQSCGGRSWRDLRALFEGPGTAVVVERVDHTLLHTVPRSDVSGVTGVDRVNDGSDVSGVTGVTGVAGSSGVSGVGGVTGVDRVNGALGGSGVAGVTGVDVVPQSHRTDKASPFALFVAHTARTYLASGVHAGDDATLHACRDLAWSLAGALLSAGHSVDDVQQLLRSVPPLLPPALRCPEWESAAESTQRLRGSSRPGTQWIGLPRLTALLGDRIAQIILHLAAMERTGPPVDAPHPRYRGLGPDWGHVAPRAAGTRPEFPLEALGSTTLIELAKAAAEALGCPLQYTAGAVLAAVSASIAGTYHLHVTAEFKSSAVLWVALIGPPASGKSPAWRLAVAPIQELNGEAYAVYRVEQQEYERRIRAARGLPARERGDEPPVPVLRQFSVDDFTFEALGRILLANPRGVAVLSEELAGWGKSFNQYRKGGVGNDRERWLRSYDGGPIQVSRQTADTIYLPNAAIPVFGTSQPEKFAALLSQMDDGLMERMMFVYPPDHPPTALPEVGIDLRLKAQYREFIRRCCSLTVPGAAPLEGSLGIESDVPTDHVLRLTAEARAVWRELEHIHVDVQRSPTFDPAYRALYGKARGYAARLALVLHIARCLDGGGYLRPEVGPDVVVDAWTLAYYFLRCAEAMDSLPHTALDNLVQRVIDLATRLGGQVPLRELLRRVHALKSAEQVRRVTRAIEDRGLGRVERRENKPGTVSDMLVLATLEHHVDTIDTTDRRDTTNTVDTSDTSDTSDSTTAATP